jgi:hypothetical protein
VQDLSVAVPEHGQHVGDEHRPVPDGREPHQGERGADDRRHAGGAHPSEQERAEEQGCQRRLDRARRSERDTGEHVAPGDEAPDHDDLDQQQHDVEVALPQQPVDGPAHRQHEQDAGGHR